VILTREPEGEHVGALLIGDIQAPFSMAPEVPLQRTYAVPSQPDGLTADGIAVSQLSAVAVNQVFAVVDMKEVSGQVHAPRWREL